jgi:N-methylhydantoinase A
MRSRSVRSLGIECTLLFEPQNNTHLPSSERRMYHGLARACQPLRIAAHPVRPERSHRRRKVEGPVLSDAEGSPVWTRHPASPYHRKVNWSRAMTSTDTAQAGPYLVGIDIGGTFTDCVIIDARGGVHSVKVPSTPADFAEGMIEALSAGATMLQLDLATFCRSIAFLSHGTTVGTNAIIQNRGAKLGLITTRGHEHALHIMRGSRGFTGRDIRKVVHFPETAKPLPIVPKRLIRGVSERVDCFGEVVARLNETEVEQAIRSLLAAGVEAIAVCFLWSFKNPAHERKVRDMIHAVAPGMFVSCSVDIAPKWGEYERVAATAFNAYLGPIMSGYLRRLDRALAELGYRNSLQISQCGGGTISVERALEAPLLTLDSGPVAGVTASLYLGAAMGCKHVITTDMGGTSFDVGIIYDARPAYTFVSTLNQYDFFLPKVDLQAIGSGGGSLVRVEADARRMTVGPDSAGAYPGPVCYQRGGAQPTVTDAQLVLGYLDADNFAGGRMRLDRRAAYEAIASYAAKLALDPLECAAGICRIVELQMADIIRKTTVEKGFDPRDFVLFAFGGAGPAHADVFARELGIRRVIVPQRKAASTWCAFGAAVADVLHIFEHAEILVMPAPASRINAVLDRLEGDAKARMAKENVAADRHRFEVCLDLRHQGQINEVEVLIDRPRLAEDYEPELRARFVARYEQLYGRGSALPGARLEIVTVRLRARALTPRPQFARAMPGAEEPDASARRPTRAIWWPEQRALVRTPVFDGESLVTGNRVAGPAIVETRDTTVVVHPGTWLRVDELANFELSFGAPLGAPS